MKTVHDTPDSVAQRRVALRARPDLSICAQQYGLQRYWLVKDPVSLAYYHLCDEEHAILAMLDGQISLAEIKRRFEAAFAPLEVSFAQLQAFFSRLHGLGLVLADAAGQAGQLLQRRTERRRREWLSALANPLAIRLRGLDPQRFLRWLEPKCRWLFSTWFLGACLAVVIGAGLLAAVQFDALRSRLPDFQVLFNTNNVLWFALALTIAKGLHELGHALVCRHFGGECHELGILFLVFTPCLYCNVSDAWTFPGKRERIAVSAAGVAVEVVLAALCTFLWWFSEPGVFHTLMLSIVVICSVNTLLLNGNPLLRYDGYYVLADWLDVPNLAQQSRDLLGRALWRICLGVDEPAHRSLAQNKPLVVAAYGIASLVYRWIVVIAILWFCYRLMLPYRLELLAQGLAAVVVGSMVLGPAWGVVRSLDDPGRRRQIRRGRAALSLVAILLAAGALLAVPLPFRVYSPVVIQAQDAHYVYAVVPGRLIDALAPGQAVKKGQALAHLENLDIRQQTIELTAQRDRQRLELHNLRLRLSDDPSVAGQIPAAEQALADLEERLRQQARDEDRLVLRAAASGVVIPPPEQEKPRYTAGALHAWSGSPLEPRNRGCHLDTGTPLCLIGDPQRLEGVLVIDQSDMTFVRTGQRVRMVLDQMPGAVLDGTIVELAKTDVKIAPRELAQESDLAVRVDRQGQAQPRETSYHARVRLAEHTQPLLVGTRGRARIIADPQPLAIRWYRTLGRVFRFTL